MASRKEWYDQENQNPRRKSQSPKHDDSNKPSVSSSPVNTLIDKLQFLNLGDTVRSAKQRFNFNAWTTPLKSIENVRRDSESDSADDDFRTPPNSYAELETANAAHQRQPKLSFASDCDSIVSNVTTPGWLNDLVAEVEPDSTANADYRTVNESVDAVANGTYFLDNDSRLAAKGGRGSEVHEDDSDLEAKVDVFLDSEESNVFEADADFKVLPTMPANLIERHELLADQEVLFTAAENVEKASVDRVVNAVTKNLVKANECESDHGKSGDLVSEHSPDNLDDMKSARALIDGHIPELVTELLDGVRQEPFNKRVSETESESLAVPDETSSNVEHSLADVESSLDVDCKAHDAIPSSLIPSSTNECPKDSRHCKTSNDPSLPNAVPAYPYIRITTPFKKNVYIRMPDSPEETDYTKKREELLKCDKLLAKDDCEPAANVVDSMLDVPVELNFEMESLKDDSTRPSKRPRTEFPTYDIFNMDYESGLSTASWSSTVLPKTEPTLLSGSSSSSFFRKKPAKVIDIDELFCDKAVDIAWDDDDFKSISESVQKDLGVANQATPFPAHDVQPCESETDVTNAAVEVARVEEIATTASEHVAETGGATSEESEKATVTKKNVTFALVDQVYELNTPESRTPLAARNDDDSPVIGSQRLDLDDVTTGVQMEIVDRVDDSAAHSAKTVARERVSSVLTRETLETLAPECVSFDADCLPIEDTSICVPDILESTFAGTVQPSEDDHCSIGGASVCTPEIVEATFDIPEAVKSSEYDCPPTDETPLCVPEILDSRFAVSDVAEPSEGNCSPTRKTSPNLRVVLKPTFEIPTVAEPCKADCLTIYETPLCTPEVLESTCVVLATEEASGADCPRTDETLLSTPKIDVPATEEPSKTNCMPTCEISLSTPEVLESTGDVPATEEASGADCPLTDGTLLSRPMDDVPATEEPARTYCLPTCETSLSTPEVLESTGDVPAIEEPSEADFLPTDETSLSTPEGFESTCGVPATEEPSGADCSLTDETWLSTPMDDVPATGKPARTNCLPTCETSLSKPEVLESTGDVPAIEELSEADSLPTDETSLSTSEGFESIVDCPATEELSKADCLPTCETSLSTPEVLKSTVDIPTIEEPSEAESTVDVPAIEEHSEADSLPIDETSLSTSEGFESIVDFPATKEPFETDSRPTCETSLSTPEVLESTADVPAIEENSQPDCLPTDETSLRTSEGFESTVDSPATEEPSKSDSVSTYETSLCPPEVLESTYDVPATGESSKTSFQPTNESSLSTPEDFESTVAVPVIDESSKAGCLLTEETSLSTPEVLESICDVPATGEPSKADCSLTEKAWLSTPEVLQSTFDIPTIEARTDCLPTFETSLSTPKILESTVDVPATEETFRSDCLPAYETSLSTPKVLESTVVSPAIEEQSQADCLPTDEVSSSIPEVLESTFDIPATEETFRSACLPAYETSLSTPKILESAVNVPAVEPSPATEEPSKTNCVPTYETSLSTSEVFESTFDIPATEETFRSDCLPAYETSLSTPNVLESTVVFPAIEEQSQADCLPTDEAEPSIPEVLESTFDIPAPEETFRSDCLPAYETSLSTPKVLESPVDVPAVEDPSPAIEEPSKTNCVPTYETSLSRPEVLESSFDALIQHVGSMTIDDTCEPESEIAVVSISHTEPPPTTAEVSTCERRPEEVTRDANVCEQMIESETSSSGELLSEPISSATHLSQSVESLQINWTSPIETSISDAMLPEEQNGKSVRAKTASELESKMLEVSAPEQLVDIHISQAEEGDDRPEEHSEQMNQASGTHEPVQDEDVAIETALPERSESQNDVTSPESSAEDDAPIASTIHVAPSAEATELVQGTVIYELETAEVPAVIASPVKPSEVEQLADELTMLTVLEGESREDASTLETPLEPESGAVSCEVSAELETVEPSSKPGISLMTENPAPRAVLDDSPPAEVSAQSVLRPKTDCSSVPQLPSGQFAVLLNSGTATSEHSAAPLADVPITLEAATIFDAGHQSTTPLNESQSSRAETLHHSPSESDTHPEKSTPPSMYTEPPAGITPALGSPNRLQTEIPTACESPQPTESNATSPPALDTQPLQTPMLPNPQRPFHLLVDLQPPAKAAHSPTAVPVETFSHPMMSSVCPLVPDLLTSTPHPAADHFDIFSTPRMVPPQSARSAKQDKIRGHIDKLLSPFRENLVRLCTPRCEKRRDRFAASVFEYETIEEANKTKIVLELPTNLLDLSIGALESMSCGANLISTHQVTPEVAHETEADARLISDLDFGSTGKAEEAATVDSLREALAAKTKQFDDLFNEHQMLLSICRALHENESTLKRALDEADDTIRVLTNRYELLKEYSNQFVVRLNEEREDILQKLTFVERELNAQRKS